MKIGENVGVKRELRFPVWACVLLYILAFFIFSSVYGLVARALLQLVGYQNVCMLYYIVMESCMLLAVLTSTFLLLHSERGLFAELGFVFKGHLKDLGYGVLMAAAFYLLGFGVSLLLGVVEVTGYHFNPSGMLTSWVFFLLVALTEELMMRGYILGRLLHTSLNKFLSLLISSLLFALLHLFNPNLAFLPLLNLVLAGMLLGASYLYTRNLCFPLALHLFWNWIQGSVLGYLVSGNQFGTSLISLHLSENTVLNGGAFGFEGSLICTVLLVIFTVLIVWWGEKREAINLALSPPC